MFRALLKRIADPTLGSHQIASEYSNLVRELPPDISDEDRRRLDATFAILYRAAQARERPGWVSIHLSKAEKDALLWAAQGKHAKTIAGHMGKSKDAVDSYLKEARRKLHAATLPEAVAKAMLLGVFLPADLLLLSPGEPVSPLSAIGEEQQQTA